MAKPALVVLGRLAAAGGQPALLLADQRLEEMTGVEFLRRARELHRRPAACSSAPLLETSLPGVFAAGDVRHGSSSGSPRPSARTRSPSSWSTSTWPRRRRPRLRPGGSERAPQDPMATGRPATAWSRAVIPAQPGVGAAAAGE